MAVKTYRARSMQEALALVRHELGTQASVLHTREIRSRGLARLWGGEWIEVVASDNVSVPGRLPDPYLNARQRVVPQSPAGLDLSELKPAPEHAVDRPRGPSRVAAYLEQGLQPLTCAADSNQAEVPHRSGAPLLVVCGAKGAGATTVSWLLARSLAGQGRRTVWVDADVARQGHPGPAEPGEGGLADVLSGRRTVHEVLTLGPDGVQCVRRAQGADPVRLGSADARRCVRELTGLAPHAEVVIADSGSEPNLLQAALWQAACAVCIIVAPKDDAILGGYACLKRYRGPAQGARVSLLVNGADEHAAECISRRFAQAGRQFLALEVTPAGHLPAGNEPACGAAVEQSAERLWKLLDSSERQPDVRSASTQNF